MLHGVGQGILLHASPTTWNCTFLISAFQFIQLHFFVTLECIINTETDPYLHFDICIVFLLNMTFWLIKHYDTE